MTSPPGKTKTESAAKNSRASVVHRQPGVPEEQLGQTKAGPSQQISALLEPGAGGTGRARAMRALQRSVGNARLGRTLEGSTPRIQRKLSVSAPRDAEEVEADSIARRVVRRDTALGGERPSGGDDVSDVSPETEEQIQAERGRGQPLPDETRREMEGAFDADFGGVRVHTDGHADRLNRSLAARAFSTGQDLFFRQGEYQPGSSGGQELLAHELTHTIQQGEAKGRAQRQSHPLVGTKVLREPKMGASVVGGDDSTITFVPAGTKTTGDVIGPGEGGYARRMLPEVAAGAAARAAQVAELELQPIEPSFVQLQKRIDWASKQYSDQVEKAGGFFTSGAWEKRYNDTAKALQSHMTLLETQRSDERGKFAAYNAWIPRANDMPASAARLDAMLAMLGVSDPAAMVTAVQEQLGKAKDLGVLAQNRLAAGEPGGVDFDVPTDDASVMSAEREASQAAKEMRASWLGFEQNVLAQRGEETKKEGAAAEEELAKIEEIKKFVRDVGKTVDVSMTIMTGAKGVMGATSTAELGKAGKETAKGVGIPMSGEGVVGAIADFIYYDEILKLKNTLNQIKARCNAIADAAAAMEIRRNALEFEARIDAFALKSLQLQTRVHARQLAYLKLGEQLDIAARSDPKAKKAGTALPKGKERFATVLVVAAQVRELLALGDGAQAAFDDPSAIKGWALELDAERAKPRSLGILSNWGGLSGEEWNNLGKLFGGVKSFHNNVNLMHKALDPVDQAGKELIKALGGEKRGEY